MQALTTRAQKDVKVADIKVHICLHGLDCLYTKCMCMQVLTTRARKDVKVADIKVQVCLYAFDCLYKNGEVLVDQPLVKRREALYSAIEEKPGELFYATAKVCPECT